MLTKIKTISLIFAAHLTLFFSCNSQNISKNNIWQKNICDSIYNKFIVNNKHNIQKENNSQHSLILPLIVKPENDNLSIKIDSQRLRIWVAPDIIWPQPIRIRGNDRLNRIGNYSIFKKVKDNLPKCDIYYSVEFFPHDSTITYCIAFENGKGNLQFIDINNIMYNSINEITTAFFGSAKNYCYLYDTLYSPKKSSTQIIQASDNSYFVRFARIDDLKCNKNDNDNLIKMEFSETYWDTDKKKIETQTLNYQE